MTLPSKELLSEVLNQAVEGSIHLKGTDLKYIISMNGYFYINIYELQHKMKEWALEQNHCFYSGIGEDECVCFIDFFEGNLTDSLFYETYLTAPTEFEAVVQACEWIRSNR